MYKNWNIPEYAKSNPHQFVQKLLNTLHAKYNVHSMLSFDWQEYTVEVEASEKPLVILHFLHNLKYRHVLCFTNSVESTHRQVTIVYR